MPLPKCPDYGDLKQQAFYLQNIANIAIAWKNDPQRPVICKPVCDYWDDLIEEWIACDDMPLLIRKGTDKGGIYTHTSGRKLVITDNAPAQWVFHTAYEDCVNKIHSVKITDIMTLLKNGSLPIKMMNVSPKIPTPPPHTGCYYHGYLITKATKKGPPINCTSAQGWYLGHKEDIKLKQEKIGKALLPKIVYMDIDNLKGHFRRFMKPSNMFVVPGYWGGLAEIPEFIKHM